MTRGCISGCREQGVAGQRDAMAGGPAERGTSAVFAAAAVVLR